MLAAIVDVQALFCGLVLAWAGAVKLAGRTLGPAVARSALATLLGPGRARIAHRGVGVAELAVALLLLTPPAAAGEGGTAALLAVGFLGYLGYARVAAPESSCGCMGTDAGPVRWRGFARAGLLLAGAVVATTATRFWAVALGEEPLVAGSVLLTEAVLLVALSPDLDRHRRRLTGRVHTLLRPHPLGTAWQDASPLAGALARLERSDLYHANRWMLTSDVQDSWLSGDWVIVSYAGRLPDTTAVDVVFAVGRDGGDVRMSLVNSSGIVVPCPPSGRVDPPRETPVPATMRATVPATLPAI